MIPYRLDLRPDPVSRRSPEGKEIDLLALDRDFATELAPRLVASYDGDVDLRPYCTESDQGNIGSCAGNATADAVEILNALEEAEKAKAEGREPNPPTQLSRLFVYALARNLIDENGDGQGDIGKDQGSYIRLCFEVLSRYGICDEGVWPYDVSKVFTLPSVSALRQAVGHKIHDYYRIRSAGEDRIWAVRSALRSRQPVVFGTGLGESFGSHQGLNPLGPPNKIVGRHAMVVVGLVGDHFLVKNSWGRGWGYGGYWVMSDDYLAWSETSDLWVPTKGSLFRLYLAVSDRPETMSTKEKTVGLNEAFESATWRISRGMCTINITDLRNAGKRGKVVTIWGIWTLKCLPFELLARDLVSLAEDNVSPEFMAKALEEYRKDLPDMNLEVRTEKGVRVPPGGSKKICARSETMSIRIEPNSFCMQDLRDPNNEPCRRSKGVQGAKDLYKWAVANEAKLATMSYSEMGDLLRLLGIPYYSFCAVD